MFSIHLLNNQKSKETNVDNGNLFFELNGRQFGQMSFETSSIPYTLKSLKNYKQNEVYGISKIDFIHSTKELYLRIFEETIQLITYMRLNNKEEVEIISEEISITLFEQAVQQLEDYYYTKTNLNTIATI